MVLRRFVQNTDPMLLALGEVVAAAPPAAAAFLFSQAASVERDFREFLQFSNSQQIGRRGTIEIGCPSLRSEDRVRRIPA